jgi:hypothetical protein
MAAFQAIQVQRREAYAQAQDQAIRLMQFAQSQGEVY